MVDNRAHGMPPGLWIVADLDGEVGDSQRNVDVSLDDGDGNFGGVVQCLVVDVRSGLGSRSRKDVQRDPQAYLVFGPRVLVGPIDQFVPDPREKSNRARRDEEIDRCWPCRLNGNITTSSTIQLLRFLSYMSFKKHIPFSGSKWIPSLSLLDLLLLPLGVLGFRVVDGELGLLSPCPVDVMSLDVLGVQMCQGTRDEVSPIPALGNILVVAQTQHDLMACLGVAANGEFPLQHWTGKDKVGQ